VIFRPPFWHFWTDFDAIGIYRKTGPTKSTVLGPGPPPWKFYKIYRFLAFFLKNGPSIEPEKPSVKSASTPYPPQKVVFIAFLCPPVVNHYGLPLKLQRRNRKIEFFCCRLFCFRSLGLVSLPESNMTTTPTDNSEKERCLYSIS
jgi:quinol-cytochrome oxidoreductase complex cytochrome b subunit